MTAWRPALRIARRDALRHRWRSLLIIVLILAPVAAGTGVDILYRTQTSAELERERSFGGADVIIDQADGPNLLKESQLRAALPTGSRMIFERYETQDVFATPSHVAEASVQLTDNLGDPLTRARVRLVSGQAPAAADEVAVSRKIAERLGLPANPIGSTVSTRDGGIMARVTGVVRDPFCLSCPLITARTNSALAAALDAGQPKEAQLSGRYFVDLPADYDGAPAARLGALDEIGASVRMRSEDGMYQIGLSDLSRVSSQDVKAVALVTLIAGLGLLEVILLAGTAFAVGARRQTRDLGMLAAQGGSPRDLRRVVLAQGLLLGAAGAVAGVGLGFGTVIASRPLLERINNEVMVGVHFGLVELVVIAAVGFLSGLAAALIPAVAASRRSTVDALAARFPVPTARSRVAPIVGALLIAGGAGLSLVASYFMTHGPALSGYVGGYQAPDGQVVLPDTARIDDTTGSIAILVGVFIVVAGLLLLTPLLLAGLARVANRMPAILRLATRDAARHRHRTGPATAAIAVAVGGAVAISCLIASDRAGAKSFEADAVPDRVIALSNQGAIDPAQLGPATAAIKAMIPGSAVIPVVIAQSKPVQGAVDSVGDQLAIEGSGQYAELGLADADLAVLASGRTASRDEAAEAFAAGKAVVFDRTLIGADGTIGILTGEVDKNEAPITVRVPAVPLSRETPYSRLPGAFLPQSVLTTNGWDTLQTTTLVSYPASSRAQAGAAIQIAEQLGIPVQTSDSERDVARLIRLGLTAAAALIALLGVAMCVALSAAEGRPDLATLSAIGAPPGRRRRLAGAQALVLATLGTALGLAFGFYFARAARPATGAVSTVVPWGDLLVTVAAVPLLAVLVAMLGTFGRVPMTRRVD